MELAALSPGPSGWCRPAPPPGALGTSTTGEAGQAELDRTLTEPQMTYGWPSGRVAFLDEVEKAPAGG